MNNELAVGEPHPSAHLARAWLASLSPEVLLRWRESLASASIEDNRMAAVCGGTLERLLNGEPVSDRYLLGLAWLMKWGDEDERHHVDGQEVAPSPLSKP